MLKKKNENKVSAKVIEKKFKTFGKKYVTFEKRVIKKIVLSLILLISSIFVVFLSLRVNVDSNLRYYETSNLNYKVNLKPNNYYDQKTLGKDMTYIASLIDTIDIDFNYNFNVSENINYKYSYYIEAQTLVKSDQGDNVIFSKKENIVPSKTQVLNNSNNFNVKELVKINYDKYNSSVKNFKSEYALSAKGELVLTLYVNILDDKGNAISNISADNKMNIVIPLTEQMIDIKMNYKETNNSNTFIAHTNVSIANKKVFYVGLILFVLFLLSLLKLTLLLLKLNRKKTPYDVKLSKILREFDRVIVESKKDIIIDEKQDIIEVKSFEELLDVRDNLEKPILFYELHKGQKSIFVVKNNYEVYKYVLKAVDLEKKK